MTEIERSPQQPDVHPEARAFVDTSAQFALQVLGYGGSPRVVFGDAWQCDIRPDSATIIIDQKSFGDESYKPAWRMRAFQHEVDAHYAKAKLQPESAEWDIVWGKEHPAGELFLNIMADIAGNREITSKDPSARADWDDFYGSKLFPENDYRFKVDKETGLPTESKIPRHIQMMYSMIREKMVPGEICEVDPEVREVLDGLTAFNGDFDLLNYVTQPYKTPTEYLSRMEQMRMWRNAIWPKYLELYEADKEDRQSDPQNGQPNTSGQDGDSTPQGFQEYYEEYTNDRHPGGTPNKSENGNGGEVQKAMDAIMQTAPSPGNGQTENNQAGQQPKSNQSKIADRAVKPENSQPGRSSKEKQFNAISAFAIKEGVKPEELQNYLALQRRVQAVIGQMHGVFEQFINERAGLKWRLSHQHAEGVLLDPDNLARTIIQMSTGREDDAKPYMDYERLEKNREMSGKLDLWLAVDCSGSMQGTKARVAAESAVAVLEGLDDFNQMVQETSKSLGYELDYDARTAVVTFGDDARVTKPLGLTLTTKERMQAIDGIQNPSSSDTRDYLALNKVLDFYSSEPSADRKKIVVVLTDGKSGSVGKLGEMLASLKQVPNLGVYAIGIEDDSAEINYAPNGKTIQNVNELPDTLSTMVTRFFR